jgi:hypothetical protein
LKASSLSLLFDTSGHDEALDLAADLAAQFEAAGNMGDLTEVRAIQTRILILRGQPARAAGWLDWLVTTTRDSGDPASIVLGFAAAAAGHAALGRLEPAAALLAEVDITPGTRATYYYAPWLPTMVRTAVDIDRVDLAEQPLTGVEPRHPYAQHALAAANAVIAEHHGHHHTAATAYADAAQRWEQFGVVPEQAHALLGQARCLIALGHTTEATPALRQARTVFEQLQAAPALAEIDALLGPASALSP